MTSKTGVAHTPGPWEAKTLMLTAGHETLAHFGISNSFWPPRPDECVANVRLCAAAPDLLKALQGVLRVADRKTDEFDAARAAIAKAVDHE